MSITVPIALWGFPFLAVLIFTMLPPRRAVILTVLLGWMFLPCAGYEFPIIRLYDKNNALILSTLFCIVLFDFKAISNYRFHWVDLPIILWCFTRVPSSIANDLGVYDGLVDSWLQIVNWGLPYFIGRLYFSDVEGLGELGRGLYIAGLVFILPCAWEMKGGPFWHAKIYGFYPHAYWQQVRYGAWRPSMFFVHGLWLGWFMATACISGAWLTMSKLSKKNPNTKALVLLVILIITNYFCRSTGALTLLAMGLIPVFLPYFRKWAFIALIAVAPIYITLRASGLWTGNTLVSAAGNLGDGRDDSMQWRIDLEGKILAHAWQRPLFGWGGWGRGTDGTGAWTEGIWTSEVGTAGFVGIFFWLAAGLVPAAAAFHRIARQKRLTPEYGAVMSVLGIVPLYLANGLVVMDFSPINYVFAGAAAAFAASKAPLPVGLRGLNPALRTSPLARNLQTPRRPALRQPATRPVPRYSPR